MSLSVGAATDHLYGLAQQAVTGVTVNGEAAVAVDGEPDELVFGMFVVGLDVPPPDGQSVTDARRTWAGIGAQRVEEDYTIPCYIDVRLPGRSAKAVRDVVEPMFNTFWTLLGADKTLGGVLKAGRFAEIDGLTYHPSNVGTVAESGRRLLLTFGVRCTNLTT